MGYFTPEMFTFLRQLKRNNNRDWFNKNKERYLADVQQPALDFIADVGASLRKISPNFVADPRPFGGSLMRVYRDTRFSKDKTPYKTNIGISFPHRTAKDIHEPGFYLHVQPGEAFLGAGIWRPETKTATAIRQAIVNRPAAWKKAVHAPPFSKSFRISSESSLARPPRGFDPEHPFVQDLKLRDFIGIRELDEKTVTSQRFLETFVAACKDAAPLMRFLCEALGLQY